MPLSRFSRKRLCHPVQTFRIPINRSCTEFFGGNHLYRHITQFRRPRTDQHHHAMRILTNKFHRVRFFQHTIIKHHCSIRINCRKTQLFTTCILDIRIILDTRHTIIFRHINRQLQLPMYILARQVTCKAICCSPLNSIGIRGFLQVDLHNTALCILVSCQFRIQSLNRSCQQMKRKLAPSRCRTILPQLLTAMRISLTLHGRRRDSIFTQIIHRGSGVLDHFPRTIQLPIRILLNLFHRRCLKALLLILGIAVNITFKFIFFILEHS